MVGVTRKGTNHELLSVPLGGAGKLAWTSAHDRLCLHLQKKVMPDIVPQILIRMIQNCKYLETSST